MSWDIKNATEGTSPVPVGDDASAQPSESLESNSDLSAVDGVEEERPPSSLTGADTRDQPAGQSLPPVNTSGNPGIAGVLQSVAQLSGIAEPQPGLPQVMNGLNAIANNALDPNIPLAEVARAGLQSMAERASVDPTTITDILELPPTTDLAELARNLQRGMRALEQRSSTFAELSAVDRAESFFAPFTRWDAWASTTRTGQANGSTEHSHSSGAGLRADETGAIRVLPLEETSPAWLSGLREGDRLMTVAGESFDGGNRVELMMRVVGLEPGSTVEVVIERAGQAATLTLTGAEWTPRSLMTKTLDDGSLFVRLRSFRPQSAEELRQVLEQNSSGQVILDLRSNGGGRKAAAEGIVDLFAAQSSLAFEHRSGTAPGSAQPGHSGEQARLVILIDEHSASSSELVAGALAAQGRALLIGTRSYGKGIGQLPFALTTDLELYLTVSRALIDGVPYHGLGITPAMCIDEEDEDLDALVIRAKKDEPLLPADFAQLRVAAADDEALRQQARQVCAPGDAPWLGEQPIELAQRLFADPEAFNNALAQQQRAMANPDAASEEP